ncbi:MAG: hypothetical protein IM638_14750 [Bacteroidetes bacterium]|nr:hypothetical protein [Bacteroidota bacterium]
MENRIDWFKKVLSSNNNKLNDFISCFDDKSVFEGLMTEDKLRLCVPLIKDGSESIFAIWQIHSEKPIEEQPIVWIETEANPISVCASNFNDFLSLMPYGGYLHNLLSKLDFYLIEGRTNDKYIRTSNEDLLNIIINCQNEYPEMSDFNRRLQSELNILPANNPFTIFINAIDGEQDFYTWMNNE